MSASVFAYYTPFTMVVRHWEGFLVLSKTNYSTNRTGLTMLARFYTSTHEVQDESCNLRYESLFSVMPISGCYTNTKTFVDPKYFLFEKSRLSSRRRNFNDGRPIDWQAVQSTRTSALRE